MKIRKNLNKRSKRTNQKRIKERRADIDKSDENRKEGGY